MGGGCGNMKTAYPNVFIAKCPFRILCIIMVQKSTTKSKFVCVCVCVCGGGGARGAYLAHRLSDRQSQLIFPIFLSDLCQVK